MTKWILACAVFLLCLPVALAEEPFSCDEIAIAPGTGYTARTFLPREEFEPGSSIAPHPLLTIEGSHVDAEGNILLPSVKIVAVHIPNPVDPHSILTINVQQFEVIRITPLGVKEVVLELLGILRVNPPLSFADVGMAMDTINGRMYWSVLIEEEFGLKSVGWCIIEGFPTAADVVQDQLDVDIQDLEARLDQISELPTIQHLLERLERLEGWQSVAP